MDYYVSNPTAGMILTNMTDRIDISNKLNFINEYNISIWELYWYLFNIRKFSA